MAARKGPARRVRAWALLGLLAQQAARAQADAFHAVGACPSLWTPPDGNGAPGRIRDGAVALLRSEPDLPFSLVAPPPTDRRIYARLNVSLEFHPGAPNEGPLTAVVHTLGCADLIAQSEPGSSRNAGAPGDIASTVYDPRLNTAIDANANAGPSAPLPSLASPNTVNRTTTAQLDVDFDYARSVVVWRNWGSSSSNAEVAACCALAPPIPLPVPSPTYRASIELTGTSTGQWDTGERDAWAPGDNYGARTDLHTTLAVAQVFGPVDYHGRNAVSLTRYDCQGYTLIRVNGVGGGDVETWHGTRTFTVDQSDTCREGWLAWLFDETSAESASATPGTASTSSTCPVGSGCHSIFTAYHWLGDEVLVTKAATDDEYRMSYDEDINALYTTSTLNASDVVATIDIQESHDWDLSFHPPPPLDRLDEAGGGLYASFVRGMACSSWNNVKTSTWNASFPTLRTLQHAYAGTDWASLPYFQGVDLDDVRPVYEYDLETTNVTRYYATRAWSGEGGGGGSGGSTQINRPLVRVVVERTSVWEFFDTPLGEDALLTEEADTVSRLANVPPAASQQRPVPIKTWTETIRFTADVFSFDASYHPDDLTGSNEYGVDVFAPCLTRLRMTDGRVDGGTEDSAFVRWTEGLVGLNGVGAADAQDAHGGLASVVRGCGCQNYTFATGLEDRDDPSDASRLVGIEASVRSIERSSTAVRVFAAGAIAAVVIVTALLMIFAAVLFVTNRRMKRQGWQWVKMGGSEEDPAGVEMSGGGGGAGGGGASLPSSAPPAGTSWAQ